MSHKIKNIGIILGFFALIFGFAIRAFVCLHFADFTGDQINDAYRTMGIWEGKFPTLGPGPAAWSGIATTEIYLPPLYYYLLFPFTILTPDLSSQAIANAVFTWLAIPTLMFTVYKLVGNIEQNKRIFISGLSGLWYSLLFTNITYSTGRSLAGNPVSIVFFLLVFILLYSYQVESKLSPKLEILSWISYGIVVSILVSLHFSTLFVMPVVFLISIGFYIYKQPRNLRKTWLLPGLSILSSMLVMTPYWVGEINRNWANTRGIISLLVNSSSEPGRSVTLTQRLNAIAHGYLDLGKEVYFTGTNWKSIAISVIFLVLILIIAFWKYKFKQPIFNLSILIWGIFLLAYSSTDLEKTYNPVFYKSLIYLAPIFLTSLSLANLNFQKILDKFLILLLIFGITISFVVNLKLHYNYVNSRSGMPRVANTGDIAYALQQVPQQATICHTRSFAKGLRRFEYIDRYVIKRDLRFVAECKPGFYTIKDKYGSLGDFRLHPIEGYQENYPLFKEIPLYNIYLIDR